MSVSGGGLYLRHQNLCVDPWVNFYTVSPDFTREEWVRNIGNKSDVLVNTCQMVTYFWKEYNISQYDILFKKLGIVILSWEEVKNLGSAESFAYLRLQKEHK